MFATIAFRAWNIPLLAGSFAAGVTYGASNAYALDLTIGGAFDDENDVLLVEFRLDNPGLFTAFTSVNDPNNPLDQPPHVSFDSQLQLFFGTGPFATFTQIRDDDGEFLMLPGPLIREVAGTTFTTGGLDAKIETPLSGGDYTLGLSTYDNDSAGHFLGNGFDGMGGNTGEKAYARASGAINIW